MYLQAKITLGIKMQVNLMDVNEEDLKAYFATAMDKVRCNYRSALTQVESYSTWPHHAPRIKPITYGGVLKTRIAFDALLDPKIIY